MKSVIITLIMLLTGIVAIAQEIAPVDSQASVAAMDMSTYIVIAVCVISVVIGMACFIAVGNVKSLLNNLREKFEFSMGTRDRNQNSELNSIKDSIVELRTMLADLSAGMRNQPEKSVNVDELATKLAATPWAKSMANGYSAANASIVRQCNDICSGVDNEMKHFENMISVLENKVSVAEKKIQDYSEMESRRLSGISDKAAAELNAYGQRAEALKKSLNGLEEMSGQIDDISSWIEKNKAFTTKLNERIVVMEGISNDVSAVSELLKKNMASLDKCLVGLPDSMEYTKMRDTLQLRLDESERLRVKLSTECENYRLRLESIEKDSSNDKKQFDEMSQKYTGLSDKLTALKKDYDMAVSDKRDICMRLENMESELSRCQEESKTLRQNSEELRHENEALKQRTAELEKENSSLSDETERIRLELEAIRPEFESLNADRQASLPNLVKTGDYAEAYECLAEEARAGILASELALRELSVINAFLKNSEQLAVAEQEQLLRSLWCFAKNITAAARKRGLDATASWDALNLWLSFFLDIGDSRFSLQLPDIGDTVTLSWMSPNTPGIGVVSFVESWAVYSGNNQSPTYKAFVK